MKNLITILLLVLSLSVGAQTREQTMSVITQMAQIYSYEYEAALILEGHCSEKEMPKQVEKFIEESKSNWQELKTDEGLISLSKSINESIRKYGYAFVHQKVKQEVLNARNDYIMIRLKHR